MRTVGLSAFCFDINVLAVNATDSVMAGHGEDLHNFCPVCGNKADQTEEEGANHQRASVSYFL